MPREMGSLPKAETASAGSVSGAKALRIEPGRPQAGSPGYRISNPCVSMMNRWTVTDSWNALDGVGSKRNHCDMPTEDPILLRRIELHGPAKKLLQRVKRQRGYRDAFDME